MGDLVIVPAADAAKLEDSHNELEALICSGASTDAQLGVFLKACNMVSSQNKEHAGSAVVVIFRGKRIRMAAAAEAAASFPPDAAADLA